MSQNIDNIGIYLTLVSQLNKLARHKAGVP